MNLRSTGALIALWGLDVLMIRRLYAGRPQEAVLVVTGDLIWIAITLGLLTLRRMSSLGYAVATWCVAILLLLLVRWALET